MTAVGSKVLVVFVDAFGPDQLRRFADRFAFLPHTKPLEGILGYSSGALPTILTGSPPRAHGRMCLFSARSKNQTSILRPLKWLGLLPRIVHERSQVRRVAEKLLAKSARLEGYVALHKVPPKLFEWLDMPERDDMFQSSDIGGERTFLADARDAGLSVYSAPWQLPESRRWEHATLALRTQVPSLAFLYATELDGIMHREGPNGPDAEAAIERIAANVERARDLMAADGSELTTLVVGDHGMAQVSTFVDPRPLLSKVSKTKLFVDSTMIRAWGTDSELARLRVLLEQTSWSGRWLDGEALQNRNVPSGNVFGEAMYVLAQGSIFAPSFLGGKMAGMHGYDIDSACAKAALASDSPIDDSVTGIDSIAAVVRKQLGLN